MGGRYRTQMGSPVYQFAHLRLGFLVCLLPFGVLQPIADSRLMDIGYVRTRISFSRLSSSTWYLSLPSLLFMQ